MIGFSFYEYPSEIFFQIGNSTNEIAFTSAVCWTSIVLNSKKKNYAHCVYTCRKQRKINDFFQSVCLDLDAHDNLRTKSRRKFVPVLKFVFLI